MHITDLPVEILEHIGDILTTEASIAPFILVSKWSHYNFQHLLARHITITPTSPPTFATALMTHAHLVHSLCIQEMIPQEFCQIHFPRLVIVHLVRLNQLTKSKNMFWNCAELFRLNPTIQDVIVHTKDFSVSKRLWIAMSTALHNPRRLRIGGVDGTMKMHGPNVAGPAIWNALSRYEEIEYGGGSLVSGYGAEVPEGSSRLKRLKFKSWPYGRTWELWSWMGKCPNLMTLHWGGLLLNRRALLNFRALPKAESESSGPNWPHLEDLHLEDVEGSDEEIATSFFCHLRPLKHLRLDRGCLGPLCFDLLRERQFGSLRTLRLGWLRDFTSKMALEVLQGCESLEVLEKDCISLKNLRSTTTTTTTHLPPWACLGLKSLRLTFEGDPEHPELDRLFFEQLSRLTRLEELDTSRLSNDGWYTTMRLSFGMYCDCAWTLGWTNYLH